MKTLTLIILLSTSLYLTGQDVNIPDANFKAALIDLGVDDNGDGNIQSEEALNTKYLDLVNYDFEDLTGINAFSNLVELFIENNMSLKEVKIVDLVSLEEIKLATIPKLDKLEINGTTALTELSILICNVLESVDVSNLTSLEKLVLIGNDNIHTINASNLSNLENLDIRFSWLLKTLLLEGTTNIEKVYLGSFVLIDNIDVSAWTKIEELNFWGNPDGFKNQVFPPLNSLKRLIIGNTGNITNLDLSVYPNLEEVWAHSLSELSDIEVSDLPKFKKLKIDFCNKIKSVNASDLPSLESVYVGYCPTLIESKLNNLPSFENAIYFNNEKQRNIEVQNSSINTLSATAMPKLNDLTLDQLPELSDIKVDDCDDLERIDLNQFSKLTFIDIRNNEVLEELLLKNGIDKLYVFVRWNLELEYICIDQVDQPGVLAHLESDDITDCVVDASCTPTASEDLVVYQQNMIYVTPTLVSSSFEIESNQIIQELSILSMMGERMMNQNQVSAKSSIDISYFPSGQYVVSVITDRGMTNKIITKI